MSNTTIRLASRILSCAMFLTVLFGLAQKSDAGQLPVQVVTMLQQREDDLQHTTFAWQVSLQQSAPDRPQEQVAAMQRATELQLPAQLKKEGITDQNAIRKQVEEAKRQVPSTMKGFSYTSTSLWRFVRYGTQTLVTGTKQLGDSRASYTQYYDGNSGMIANTGMYFQNAENLHTDDPNVWRSPGDSVRYRSLFQQSLGLLPEHYAMLLGLNPLSMYGAKWSLISASPTTWTMQTQVRQNDFAPFDIQIMLSRKYNGTPVQLKVRSKDEIISLQVESFQKIDSNWIANRAVFSDKWLGFLSTNQTWTLKAITHSMPIVVKLSQKQLVHDYRLLGPNLLIQGLNPMVNHQQQESIIYYRWPGHFPSDEELKRMYQKQNPGEASPDVGQNGLGNSLSASNIVGSTLPFAGGILCLVGGVWMFKQRKVN